MWMTITAEDSDITNQISLCHPPPVFQYIYCTAVYGCCSPAPVTNAVIFFFTSSAATASNKPLTATVLVLMMYSHNWIEFYCGHICVYSTYSCRVYQPWTTRLIHRGKLASMCVCNFSLILNELSRDSGSLSLSSFSPSPLSHSEAHFPSSSSQRSTLQNINTRQQRSPPQITAEVTSADHSCSQA